MIHSLVICVEILPWYVEHFSSCAEVHSRPASTQSSGAFFVVIGEAAEAAHDGDLRLSSRGDCAQCARPCPGQDFALKFHFAIILY